MKSIRHIALGAFLTLSVFCAVLYSSCSKDACGSVTCLNKGVCKGGTCQCIKGIGGANCDVVYRKDYANDYIGNPLGNTNYNDSNNQLRFAADADTADYNTMHVTWFDTGRLVVTLPVVLANNSSSGSTFTIPSTTASGFVYSGNGTITSTSASMSLKQVNVVDTTLTILRFENFSRK